MPFFTIPFSVKIAVAIGAAVGAGMAVANNQEAILQAAETIFTKSADYCRQRLDKVKIKNSQVIYADDIDDFELSEARATGSNLRDGESDYENVSTPDTTDFSEIDTDMEGEEEEEEEEDNDNSAATSVVSLD
ncbi:hypothetical protein KGF56_001018 [Candida oxycetoniae]|uniref:Uncharacterized protein n=1 Tax=Candida oxycetoniae TaxID=497107 RepID=A0AAI9WZ93_9ASCO|nr:uncharacterized protein KGF56_001018 [Candida oxycetoniae]KAI3406176.2 hypothetical protein KGF56_001018 [Candida oxycetoniae]